MKYIDYIDLNYKPKASDLVAYYFIEPWKCSMYEAAGAVAAESSVGTWTEVSTMNKKIEKLAAHVFSIKGNFVKIAYPGALFEKGNIPQILSSIAGNVFGMKDVKNLKLLDIYFPREFVKSFPGPMFGINGIRKLLRVRERPLIGTIIKPKLGLDIKSHNEVALHAWLGGCDMVKDDENLTSMRFNEFRKRVAHTLRIRDFAEKITREKKIYIPNITSETCEMIRRASYVKHLGGEYVMVDIISCGWSALQTLMEYNKKLKLVIHAHRAGYAAFSRNPKHGISMLVIAKLARLIGIDQLHIGTIVGKMDTPREEVVAIGQEIEKELVKKNEPGHLLEQSWHGLKSVFAVCSGGLHPRHIPYIIKQLGKNIILQFGGGIHGHPLGTFAGAKAVRQAVEAVLKKVSLEKYALNHIELKKALEFFK